jgi:hypothetical protein
MLADITEKALKQDLWICAPANANPTIIVPPSCQELLVRDTHQRMFHLSSAKVFALLRKAYFWVTMKRDVRKWLEDCPQCELNKARQNTAHGLFSPLPVHAPRARWCMDFQGQGTTPRPAIFSSSPCPTEKQARGYSPSWTVSYLPLVHRTSCIQMLLLSFYRRP